jgi:hypothetical protein
MLRDPLTPKHKLGVCCWGWALVEQNSTARLLQHAHLPRPAGPGFCQGRKRFPYQLPFAVWFCSAAGRLVPHSPDIRFHGGSTPEYSHQRQPPPLIGALLPTTGQALQQAVAGERVAFGGASKAAVLSSKHAQGQRLQTGIRGLASRQPG